MKRILCNRCNEYCIIDGIIEINIEEMNNKEMKIIYLITDMKRILYNRCNEYCIIDEMNII